MFKLPPKLFLYFAKNFLNVFVFITVGLSFLLLCVDLIDGIKKFDKEDETFLKIIFLSVLKIPSFINDVVSFIVLFSAMLTTRKFVSNNEINVIKSNGLSLWNIITPFWMISLLIGLISSLLIYNLGVFSEKTAKNLEKNLDLKASTQIQNNNFWIIAKDKNKNNLIMQISQINKKNPKNIIITDISIFVIDENEQFIERIDSKTGNIEENFVNLNDPIIKNIKDIFPKSVSSLKIETIGKTFNIFNVFTQPKQLYLWQIIPFIKKAEKIGLNTNEYYLHFYNTLSSFILMVGMCFIGIRFAINEVRKKANVYIGVFGIMIGFLVYFIDNMLIAFAISDLIPIYLAAIGGKIIILFVGINLLLFKEGM